MKPAAGHRIVMIRCHVDATGEYGPMNALRACYGSMKKRPPTASLFAVK